VELIAGAACAREFPDLGTFLVTFAQNADGSGWSFSVQLPLRVTKQDIALGQDTYCVTTSAGPAVYGGIASWELTGDQVEISLEQQAAERLHLSDDHLLFRLPDSAAAAPEIAAGLIRILGTLT